MAEVGQRDRRAARRRERLAVFVMALFPLFVASGFLAPGMVEILALAAPVEEPGRLPIVDRLGRFAHRPLVPRDFSAGFVPELLDLDQLFQGSDFRVDASDERIARLSSFRRSDTDSIVIDDVGQPRSVAFKDILMDEPDQVVARAEGDSLMSLCGTLYAANCVRDDDFIGGVVEDQTPVPEPGTAALLGLGLASVAGFRRRAPTWPGPS